MVLVFVPRCDSQLTCDSVQTDSAKVIDMLSDEFGKNTGVPDDTARLIESLRSLYGKVGPHQYAVHLFLWRYQSKTLAVFPVNPIPVVPRPQCK